MLIIGIAGYAGVGKDTVADLLGYPKVSFATALKNDLAPLIARLGIDPTVREQKEKVRDLYVEYGRTARSINPRFWIDRIRKEIDWTQHAVVIPDVRYWNEVLWIKEQGGCWFWLKRDGVEPRNPEESLSFEAIRLAHRRENIPVPYIQNPKDNPQAAANRIKELLRINDPVRSEAL